MNQPSIGKPASGLRGLGIGRSSTSTKDSVSLIVPSERPDRPSREMQQKAELTDGQLVEQHAQRIHSYMPSSFFLSSCVWRNSPFAGGLSFFRNGSIDLYCLLWGDQCIALIDEGNVLEESEIGDEVFHDVGCMMVNKVPRWEEHTYCGEGGRPSWS